MAEVRTEKMIYIENFVRSAIAPETIVAAVAQNDTIANTSKLQPSIPEMGAYWTNAESLGKALANGEINDSNAAEMTEKWNAGINNSGL